MYDVGLEVMFLEFVGLLSQPSKCATVHASMLRWGARGSYTGGYSIRIRRSYSKCKLERDFGFCIQDQA